MAEEKTTLMQKDSEKGIASSNYRPITCLPMMWKILTAQIREEICYLLIRTKIMPQGNKRNKWLTVQWSTLPQGVQDEMDCQQKEFRYYHAKQCKNLQNSQQSNKVHDGSQKNWKVELTARSKNFSWERNPERYLPGRYASTIIIGNCDDGT